jgi:predicted Zn-dependent protease
MGVSVNRDDVAHQVVELVRAVDPAAEAEVVVQRADLAVTRFANSHIHQNMSESTTTVRLRLHTDGRTATGSTTVTDAAGLPDLVDRTVAATRLSPPDPRWAGLTAPTPVSPDHTVDDATATAPPARRAELVRRFVAAAGGLETAGSCQTLGVTVAFANTAGHSAEARAAGASLDAIARDRGVDGLARVAAPRVDELDGGRLGERAARKARAGQDPVELPPGRYEVVLEPTAVADLLLMLAYYGFNGKAVLERHSFVEVGATQFDPAISLVDDPAASAGVALPFDVEGTPRRRTVFVDSGVTREIAHDRRTAAQSGAESTAHAIVGGSSMGAIPPYLELVAAGGAVDPDAPVDAPVADAAVGALVSDVERGLLVTDNWYTRVLDPRTLVVTGLTRNGVWLIEDGVVTRPVQNLRFTQSYPAALAPGAVLGVGAAGSLVPGGWSAGWTFRAPALRLASWNYTGNASG